MAANTPGKPAKAAKKKASGGKPRKSEATIRFRARLSRPEADHAAATWAVLQLPGAAGSMRLPAEATMVEGTIEGFPFRTAVAPARSGRGGHRIMVNKAVQDAIGAGVGDEVAVEITRVGEEPEVRAPADLRAALDAAAPPKAQAVWADITPMARRDWVLWIISAKQGETRRRRIENACEMLGSGKRRPCCMPGINWRTKDSDVTSEETWVPLPGAKGAPSPARKIRQVRSPGKT